MGMGNDGFDHMTVVVTDLDEAKRFFGLLGFEERISVVVSGEEMSRYMGIADWTADHVTLVLDGATKRYSSCISISPRWSMTRAPALSIGPASITSVSGSGTWTAC
jgi:hypothetical protein